MQTCMASTQILVFTHGMASFNLDPSPSPLWFAMYKATKLSAIQMAACLGFFVVQLDVSVVNVGLGALKAAFDTNLTGLQWVINSYALTFSALLIFGGSCGDKLGAKPVFVGGFIVFTLSSLGCGLAGSMVQLISFRCVQGLGAALMIPTSLTLLRLNFTNPEQRKAAVALWGASGGIALAAGPVLGGRMIEHLGWRSVFLINIPLGLLAIALTLRYTPASPKVEKRIDVYGQVTIALALALLTYGLTEASERGWSLIPLSVLALSCLVLLAFVLIEQRVAAPMIPVRLARNTVLIAMMLTGSVINFTFYGVVFVLSIYFQTIVGYDAVRTGLAFIPLTAVMTLSSLASARLGRHFSALRIMTLGTGLQVCGFLILSRISPDSASWMLDSALIIVGIGSAATVPSMNNTMLAAVTQQDAGIASGLMSSARQVGGVLGVAIFGLLIAHAERPAFTQGMSTSMLLCVAALALCLVTNLWLVRKVRSSVLAH